MRTAHATPPGFPAEFGLTELPLDLCFGGHRLLLRWLQPGDLARLLEFFESHTRETLQDRYGYAPVQMTVERAAALVGVDQERDIALGVFRWWEEAWHLIAVGRYCLLPSGNDAELAFVVHEDWRRLGIATTLLQALVRIARQCGLERLVAQVHRDNFPMLAVFRRAGASIAAIEGTSDAMAVLDLRDAPIADQ